MIEDVTQGEWSPKGPEMARGPVRFRRVPVPSLSSSLPNIVVPLPFPIDRGVPSTESRVSGTGSSNRRSRRSEPAVLTRRVIGALGCVPKGTSEILRTALPQLPQSSRALPVL